MRQSVVVVERNQQLAVLEGRPSQPRRISTIANFDKELLPTRRWHMPSNCLTVYSVVFMVPALVYLTILFVAFSVYIQPEDIWLTHIVKPINVAACSNFISFAIIMLPVLFSLATWHSMQYASDIARATFTSSHDNKEELDEAILDAKRLGGLRSGLWLHICIFLVALITACVTILGTELNEETNKLILWSYIIAIVFTWLTLIAIMRNLALGTLRREQANTEHYVFQVFVPRIIVAVIFQALCVFYIVLCAANAPIGTLGADGRTQRTGGVPSPRACLQDVNASYIAAHCYLDHFEACRVKGVDRACEARLDAAAANFGHIGADGYTSFIVQGGLLRCDDGGFGVYGSVYDACEASAGVELLLRKTFDFLWCGTYFVCAILFREVVAGLDDMLEFSALIYPRLDLPHRGSRFHLLATATIVAFASTLFIPFYLLDGLVRFRPHPTRDLGIATATAISTAISTAIATAIAKSAIPVAKVPRSIPCACSSMSSGRASSQCGRRARPAGRSPSLSSPSSLSSAEST